MWLLRPLNNILSSTANTAVLRVVLSAGVPLCGREIARRSGVGYGSAYNALQELVASSVLSKQDHGRASTYSVRDPEAPLVAGLRHLFEAEDARTRRVVSELVGRIPDTRSVVLFGSEARGSARAGSDTDLLVIVDRNGGEADAAVRDACLDVAEEHGLALSWHVVSLDAVREWDSVGEQFWLGIVRDGVCLHGDSPEVLRLRWRLGRTSSERRAASGR